jgi:spermidine/putrescine transport system substrate-binding protein
MKTTHRFVVSALWIVAAVAGFAAPASARKAVLHVYSWADYIKPELVTRFEEENQCSVVIDTFDSNEAMYAKLKAGATGYDILVPSSYMVRIMYDQGMLQPINRNLVPNLKNIDPEYLKIAIDKEMDHSVPYMLTNTGLAYLGSRVKDFVPSWTMLDRADLKGRITMLNDMRETIGAALKFLGYSLNTLNEEELARARDVVIRWKKNLAKFENEQYKTGLASGEFLLVHGYSGDILQVQEENDDIVFVIPKEGFSVSCDDLVVPKEAENVELAHRFINFLHDPKVAAENTEFISYLCPNLPSYDLLNEEIRNDPTMFPPPEVRAKGEVILDLGADNVKYTKIWDQIKAAD